MARIVTKCLLSLSILLLGFQSSLLAHAHNSTVELHRHTAREQIFVIKPTVPGSEKKAYNFELSLFEVEEEDDKSDGLKHIGTASSESFSSHGAVNAQFIKKGLSNGKQYTSNKRYILLQVFRI